MFDTIKFKGTDIAFTDNGQGNTIILLHGYIEALNAWEEFEKELAKKYRVISVDLPGHGQSGTIADVHSMALMAESVKAVMENRNIDKAFLVGHSMGGYVTMEFLNLYPDKVAGFCLFHSTPFADDEERKAVRDRLIEAIKAGKKVQLAKEHVEKTFAKENLPKFVKEVGFLKIIAVNTSEEGTIAALRGMKQRKDHSDLLQTTEKPGLWILGKKDNFIPHDAYKKLNLPQNIEIKTLENSGHQGYIEEKAKSLNILEKFIEKNKFFNI